MSETIFELQNVNFSYQGKFSALVEVNMRVAAGQKIAVIGANGTGKSTILTLLDGLIFPDKGSIKAFGRELSEEAFSDEDFSRTYRKKVGFVFQNPDIQLFCPTVKEDIIFGPLQLGVPEEEIESRLIKLTELFELKGLLERMPHQLSIGEKRKVAIASVLAIEPEVILLDEPTAGIDPATTRHIIDTILEANARGTTVITATHDLHIVEEISDIVYIFDKSKSIIRSGIPCEVLTDNEFLTQNNLVHIHSHKHKDKVHTHPHSHMAHHPEQDVDNSGRNL
jgi:cobalt/nickel transport system ATP-binding protein